MQEDVLIEKGKKHENQKMAGSHDNCFHNSADCRGKGGL